MKYKIKKSPILETVAEMHESVKMVHEAIEVVNNWVADMTHGTWCILDDETWPLVPMEGYESKFHVKTTCRDNYCDIVISKITGYTYSIVEVKERRTKK